MNFLSYSRIVVWGRDFRGVRAYVVQNMFESMGLISYRPRQERRRPVRAGPGDSS